MVGSPELVCNGMLFTCSSALARKKLVIVVAPLLVYGSMVATAAELCNGLAPAIIFLH